MSTRALVSRKKILIVDDEASIRAILRAIMEREGYQVEVAEDGYVALQRFQQFNPDLVISDLRMPNMNGFELLSVLRTRYPEVPTIALSGEFFTREGTDALIADAFFPKGSYSIADMLAKISELLHRPAAAMSRRKPEVSPLWKPVGNSPVMLTCTHCLRSFPIELCDSPGPAREANCIFCGQHLEIEVVAIGMPSH